ncbi:hypothetical protein [Desulfovermiculus halophilus]|jgi:hypothetical protein|uniref:hypothetical protein n=1 Tax=Desulfovermiculus halophilus TaxID=339722 RepID=UPI0004878DF4|nr:hypothetical protein [Desulfovermiculus halophilus]
MEDLHQENSVSLGREGEVIFVRKGSKMPMICPYSPKGANCSHNCPLLVEMTGGGSMEKTYTYLKFCNGTLLELSGDERK